MDLKKVKIIERTQCQNIKQTASKKNKVPQVTG